MLKFLAKLLFILIFSTLQLSCVAAEVNTQEEIAMVKQNKANDHPLKRYLSPEMSDKQRKDCLLLLLKLDRLNLDLFQRPCSQDSHCGLYRFEAGSLRGDGCYSPKVASLGTYTESEIDEAKELLDMARQVCDVSYSGPVCRILPPPRRFKCQNGKCVGLRGKP